MNAFRIAALIAALAAVSCGDSPPRPGGDSIPVTVVIPSPPQAAMALEVVLTPEGGAPIMRRVAMDPSLERDADGAALVRFQVVPGDYSARARALVTDDLILYEATREIAVVDSKMGSSRADGGLATAVPESDGGASDSADLNKFVVVIERSVGAVDVTTPRPPDSPPALIFEAVLGPFRARMAPDASGRLAAVFPSVPSGANQVIVVEGRDRAGSVLYQGVAVATIGPQARAVVNAVTSAIPLGAGLPRLRSESADRAVVGTPFQIAFEPGFHNRAVGAALTRLAVDWGDGTLSEVPLPPNASDEELVRASHTFGDAGPHIVTATLTSGQGHAAQSSVMVAVEASEPSTAHPRTTAWVRVEALNVPANAASAEAALLPAHAEGQPGPFAPSPLLRERGHVWADWRLAHVGELWSLVASAGPAQTTASCSIDAFVTACSASLPDQAPLPGAGGRLVLANGGVWLGAAGTSVVIEVRAYDAERRRIAVDALDLEWLSSDARRIAVAPDPGRPDAATVTALVGLASAHVVVRSRTNPELMSRPLSVTVAPLKPGVAIEVLPTARIVYTPLVEIPPDGRLPDVEPLDGIRNLAIGSFTTPELESLVDTERTGALKAPMVLRGAAPAPGALVVGGDGSFGRVVVAENRDAFSVVQLEAVQPNDIFSDYDYVYDHEDLGRRGLVYESPVVPQAKAAAPASPLHVFASLPSNCKTEGSATGLDMRADATLNPNWVAIAQVRRNAKNEDILKLRVGVRARAGFALVLNLQAGVVGNVKCDMGPGKDLKIPLGRVPVLGVPVGLDYDANVKPIWDFQFKTQLGSRLAGSYRCAFKADEVVGFDLNLSTGAAEPRMDLGLPEVVPCRFDNNSIAEAFKSDLRQLRFELKTGPFLEHKGGLQLSAGPFRSPSLDLLAVKFGLEGVIAWENARYVLPFRRSGSTIHYAGLFEAKLDVRNWTKVLERFKAKKIFEVKPLAAKAVVAHQYRPLEPKFVRVNGRAAPSPLSVAVGRQIRITVGTTFDAYRQMSGLDDPPRRGELWWDNDGQYEKVPDFELLAAGPDRVEGVLTVTPEMCQRFENEDSVLRIIGYNDMFFGRVPTPGYIGSLKLRCSDDVFFTADEISIPSPDGLNIAIVGDNVSAACGQEVEGVRLVANLSTKPNDEWSVDSAIFRLDGSLLAEGSGPSPLVLPAPGQSIRRNLSPGAHELSLEYVVRKGSVTRAVVRKERLHVRNRLNDLTLQCNLDSPSRITFRSAPPPAFGPISVPGTGNEYPELGRGSATYASLGDTPIGPGPMPQVFQDAEGISSGDPHIATADGLTYSTMTLGEFVLARAWAPGGLEVQARHGRLTGFAEWASFNVAAAVRAAGHVYEVRLPGFATNSAARGPLEVLLDGKSLSLPPGAYTIGGTLLLLYPDETVEVRLQEPDAPASPGGGWTSVRIGKGADNGLVRINESEPVVSLHVSLVTPRDRARYAGLLGTPNGLPDDDLTGPDGKRITSLAGFIEAWRVRDRSQSLFTYGPGQGPETFNVVQDRRSPSIAELEGAGGGRNYVAEVRTLIASACGEAPDAIEAAFIMQLAMDLAAGRTARNMIAAGLCGDSRVFSAGQRVPASTCLSFSGRVVVPGGAAGAAGVEVHVTSPTVGLDLCRTVTDGNGNYACGYVFARPSEPAIDLLVRVTSFDVTAERRLSVPTPAAGELASVAADFELARARLVHVRGRVLATDGQPQANAYLRVPVPYRVFRANADGLYDLVQLVDPRTALGALRIDATNADGTAVGHADLLYDTTEPGVIELARDIQLGPKEAETPGDGLLNLEKRRRVTLIGRVLSGSPPMPLAAADVTVTGDGIRARCRTRSGLDGRFACSVEPLGDDDLPVTIEASLAGSGRRVTAHTVPAVRLPAPNELRIESVGDLVVAPTTLRIVGRALADAASVPDVEVAARVVQPGFPAARSRTDETGAFAIDLPVPDAIGAGLTFEVDARWVGNDPTLSNRVTVRRPLGPLNAGEVNLRKVDVLFVDRKLALTGRVLNELANGQPVADAAVEITRVGDATPLCDVRTDARGIYQCDHVVRSTEPVQFRYRVSGRGSAMVEGASFDPATAQLLGRTPVLRDLAVRATTLRVSGTVESGDGQPIAAAQVSLVGELGATLSTSAAGVFDAYFDFPDGVQRVSFSLRATDGTAVTVESIETLLAPGALTTVNKKLVIEGNADMAGKLLWKFESGAMGGDLVNPAVGADGSAFFIVDGATGKRLYAVSAAGIERWHYDFRPDENPSPKVVVAADGSTWVGSRAGLDVHAIDSNGARRFVFKSGAPVLSDPLPTPDGGALAVLGSKLHRISAQGSSSWSVDVNATEPQSAVVRVMPDGSLRALTNMGYKSGKGSWASVTATGERTGLVELDVGYDEVLAANADGSLLAFRNPLYEGPSGGIVRIAADGNVLWSAGSSRPPVLGPDGSIYSSGFSQLTALDPMGSIRWSKTLDRLEWAVVSTTGVVFAVTDDLRASDGERDNQVRSFGADGKAGWTFGTGGAIYQSTPLPGPNGSLIVLVDRKVLTSLTASGAVRWRFEGDFQNGYRVAGTIANGILYFADAGRLFGIRP